MGNNYGRTLLGQTGNEIMVQADGRPLWKVGGATIDWSDVVAVSADTTLPDGTIVKNGQKYLRYGQVLCRKGVAEIQTVTISGSPGGGTFTLTLPATDTEDAQTTGDIAYNAAASAVQTALEALSRIGAGNVTVSGSAGGPYTITFNKRQGNVGQLTSTSSLTGGTSPAIAHATSTSGGSASGKFGPYDPNATDGRQTTGRGVTFVLNQTVLENGPLGLGGVNSNIRGVLEGGAVWRDRVLATNGTASLAAGPTFANLEAALPQLTYAEN